MYIIDNKKGVNNMKFVPSRKAREVLGVHENTPRRWANEGKIRHIRTAAGQRLYDTDSFAGNLSEKRRVCYCRVSSCKQRDDLGRQVASVAGKCPGYEIVTDIGSGLSFKRKGLVSLLESVCSGNVSEVVAARKDRLAKFGSDELVRWIIEYHGGKLLVLSDDYQSPQS
jgi:putative resolvase